MARKSTVSPERMKLVEQLIQNTAKMRGLGPDDPINWDEIGTSEEGGENRPSSPLWGGVVPSAFAATQEAPVARGTLIDSLLDKIQMFGLDPEVYSSPTKWQQRKKY